MTMSMNNGLQPSAAPLQTPLSQTRQEERLEVHSCPHCDATPDGEAAFCSECGADLLLTAKCPACQVATFRGGDLCEACGSWLLADQCRFCYAQIEEDQKFCGLCGNPPTGIRCDGCGQVRIFDYCPTCLLPLTEQARETTTHFLDDPLFHGLVACLTDHGFKDTTENVASLQVDLAPLQPEAHQQYLQLKAYREALPALRSTPSRPVRRNLFPNDEAPAGAGLDHLIVQEQERLQRIEEERKRQEEERKRQEEERKRQEEERKRQLAQQISQIMTKFSNRTFPTQQEARRFFMGMLASLPKELAGELEKYQSAGWRCNAYGVVHSGGPDRCADPSRGGTWVLTED
jgi:hypothetical protein